MIWALIALRLSVNIWDCLNFVKIVGYCLNEIFEIFKTVEFAKIFEIAEVAKTLTIQKTQKCKHLLILVQICNLFSSIVVSRTFLKEN